MSPGTSRESSSEFGLVWFTTSLPLAVPGVSLSLSGAGGLRRVVPMNASSSMESPTNTFATDGWIRRVMARSHREKCLAETLMVRSASFRSTSDWTVHLPSDPLLLTTKLSRLVLARSSLVKFQVIVTGSANIEPSGLRSYMGPKLSSESSIAGRIRTSVSATSAPGGMDSRSFPSDEERVPPFRPIVELVGVKTGAAGCVCPCAEDVLLGCVLPLALNPPKSEAADDSSFFFLHPETANRRTRQPSPDNTIRVRTIILRQRIEVGEAVSKLDK